MTGSETTAMRTVVAEMAERLAKVPGVVGVLLGGSRARGEHRPESDWDLGVYYRGELDLDALRALAGPDVEVAGPGGWGPWVNGGAWLRVDGVAVDWILRDLDRVRRVWADCREGRYEVGAQVGHPLGFWSPCYAGEVALGQVLADPTGELAELRREAATYPEPLRDALVAGAGEARFLVGVAAKGAARADTLYVALCLSRAVGVLTQALFAHDRRWCLNEKGALAVAQTLPGAPHDFGARANGALGRLGGTPESLALAVAEVRALVEEASAAVGGTGN
ncbi:nucleotidyltransferase domain-containing protein [Actinospica durhamensis]|uniref:Nucleotidyltransferase domain-containing protein n=1 Tax=Actinospica durhamensis TaxID=1508375 RepID=A0A941ISH8_9ACTN|nr:nucleotidyltransferase domain-containing protein [Actinospica durhamensis]MBR7836382.1 nucleotidyltransferase domain-containing protein [Actinospica durhamensis]